MMSPEPYLNHEPASGLVAHSPGPPDEGRVPVGNVLVVDDNPVSIEVIAQALREDGHAVLRAASAAEALEQVTAGNVDVVVADLHMPEMDGFDLALRLRELCPDVPVVYASADESLASVLRAVQMRAFGYVLKQEDAMRLMPSYVRRALAHVRALRENRDLAAQLKGANEDLEQRVLERTAELENAVSQLEEREAELRNALTLLEESRQRALLNERLAALGLLAAGVAHDVNNPAMFVLSNLRAALGDLDELRIRLGLPAPRGPVPLSDPPGIRESSEPGPERATQLLARAETLVGDSIGGVERVLTTVTDINRFAKPPDAVCERVDLNEVASAAIKLLNNQIRHRAQLETRFAEAPLVLGSPARLVQVVVNLLSNAAYAVTEGDSEANCISVVTECGADEVTLTVMDTGCGIPEHELHRVGEPFFTTKPAGSGTGLGLTLCQRIVADHQGRLEIASQVGRGTSVTVSMPRAPLACAEVPAEDEPAPLPLSGLRILVIDDEQQLLRAYRRELGRQNEVVTACGGSEALELLASDSRFDLLLCDLMMPELDGPVVHAAIQAHWPALARRMIFVTGGAFTERNRGFSTAVGSPVVMKPLRSDELARAYAKLPALSV
jgi:signal transduction histidine kinase